MESSGDQEERNHTYAGTYMQKGNVEVITYTEIAEGFGEINNRITIRTNRVHIKRSGQVRMNQQFMVNRRTESLYRHPYGNMVMTIHTKQISYRPLSEEKAGYIKMTYDVDIEGQAKKRHFLTMTYMEE